MEKYRVVWEIDIDSESPKDAAIKALEIQRNQYSIATVFNVINCNGQEKTIDLDD